VTKLQTRLPGKLVVVLKGYPRLSETFIAQELHGLELVGMELEFVSLRHPTDSRRHPIHDDIAAAVNYLPEYLHQSPMRVVKSLLAVMTKPGFLQALMHFLIDLRRDFSRNRLRRFGQAAVLAAEWPADGRMLYAHFIHTPASVARYASELLGVPWVASAHAKDIWTSPDWEITEKLASARWVVTCTGTGHRHLQSLAADPERVYLSYHGLNLDRFPAFGRVASSNDGSIVGSPVVILSVGRAVVKKGYDTLLHALALLPPQLHWRFVHIGAGTELDVLQALAEELEIDDKIEWLGAVDQTTVLSHYQAADLFALACRVADDGDRDGLPNVLVEASSQALTCISTNISAVPELIDDGENGFLVPTDNAQQLAERLSDVISDPEMRHRLGVAAQQKVRSTLDYHKSIEQLVALFADQWGGDTR